MRFRLSLAGPLILAVTLVAGCLGQGSSSSDDSSGKSASLFSPKMQIPAGTTLPVRLTSTISSEDAHEGDAWTGVLTAPVMVGDKVALPVGSAVDGVVKGVRPAEKGDRAMVELAVERVTADGDDYAVEAGSEPVIAGSPRARNLGAIAGGTAAGAILGKAIGGDGKGAATGAIIGGAAATGAVAASKGYQVVLKSGTRMTFDTTKAVRVSA